jgi:predicted phosphodiesterase
MTGRIGLISDIHGNLGALERALQLLRDVRQIICLGDVVGYGPQPAECIRLLRSEKVSVIQGNHDHAVGTGEIPAAWRDVARATAEWSRNILPPDDLAWLAKLPTVLRIEGLQLIHEPDQTGLNLPVNPITADSMLGAADAKRLAFGHTHIPMLATKSYLGHFKTRPVWSFVRPVGGGLAATFHPDQPMLINPGSVGQPRDRSPDGSYCTLDFDSNVIHFFSVAFDRQSLQKQILSRGYQQTLASEIQAVFGFPGE